MSSEEQKILHLEQLLREALSTNERLAKRVAELEAELKHRSVKKTSNNSSIAPSTDMARKNQSLRVSSGKPVGGQIGHAGHNLALSATPDTIIEVAVQYCKHCGTDLKEVCGVALNRRQVVSTR